MESVRKRSNEPSSHASGAEVALRSSELRLQRLLETDAVGILFFESATGTLVEANDVFLRMAGYTREQVHSRQLTWRTMTPPEWIDVSEEQMKRFAATGRVGPYEKEYFCADASRRWMLFTGRDLGDGTVAEYCIDVTDRKKAEEALASMSKKLIAAQEQERARIGRELHDDINQRLAMVAIELGQLQDNPSEVRSRLQDLQKQVTEISNYVQALSHELHSSKLEYLGVVAGMKSWCREFGNRHSMEIEFKSDVASVLQLEVGVCMFRVLQEALHNVLKHSGQKRVEVQVTEHSNEVHLIIHDSGKGFDVEAAMQDRGLGLTSMQERVRLVNGTFTIESLPMGGTTVHVRVPFKAIGDSARAHTAG